MAIRPPDPVIARRPQADVAIRLSTVSLRGPSGPWQSQGTDRLEILGKRYFPEIATASSKPRNDKFESVTPNRVIARSEATWQSVLLAVGPGWHCLHRVRIATAPSGPRNDRCGLWSAPGLRFPLSLRGAKRRGNPFFLQLVHVGTACTGYGLPRA